MHLITYGKDKKTGKPRYIEDVPRGLDCNCVCPECGSKLEAHKGNVQRHHFQHYSVAECKGAYESQLHLLSKAIIEENKALMLPLYEGKYCSLQQKRQSFTEVVQECAQDDLQPDCLCKYMDEHGNEQTLWVEIFYSHAVDDEKARKIQERHIACVEIDVSSLFRDVEAIDKDVLTDFLLNSPDRRKWINNPQGDERVLAEAAIIRNQESIISFIKNHSDDESCLHNFQAITYCLFSTNYHLLPKDYNSLYSFIKKYQSNYKSLNPVVQRRYVSALQMILCNLVVTGKYNVRGFTIEKQLYAICYDRNNLVQQLPYWVDKTTRLGESLFQPQRKPIVRQSSPYFFNGHKYVKRRRF